MIEADCKLLTEYLGECWHELLTDSDFPALCSCGKGFTTDDHHNRTFTTEADMMALYRRLWKTGKWASWLSFVYPKYGEACGLGKAEGHFAGFDPWFLCLSGEGYEERCQMVSKFLEEKYDNKMQIL